VSNNLPFSNGAAPGISASFLNNVEQVFKQPSGGAESGHYFLAGPVPSAGAVISAYIPTLSRTTVPVSVSFDTADMAATGGMGTINTGNLTSGGFQIWCTNGTNGSTNARAGGNWTVSY